MNGEGREEKKREVMFSSNEIVSLLLLEWKKVLPEGRSSCCTSCT